MFVSKKNKLAINPKILKQCYLVIDFTTKVFRKIGWTYIVKTKIPKLCIYIHIIVYLCVCDCECYLVLSYGK